MVLACMTSAVQPACSCRIAPPADAAPPNADALAPKAGALAAPKGLAAAGWAPKPPNDGAAPNALVGAAPNAGVLAAPKAGVLAAPNAGVGVAPNAGALCGRWGRQAAVVSGQKREG